MASMLATKTFIGQFIGNLLL
ncbi:hypothetical protein GJ496_009957 [Pomphorhynchus laevis]|nr:hypothetical protein GJ496_009957 [Pomphorhynchus laevis]